jgi:hypothetical protein
MKVSTTDGKTFTLECESQADRELVDAIDFVRHVTAVKPIRAPHEHGGWINSGYTLRVDREDPQKLIVDTARQTLRSLGDLFRVGLREAALDGHVGADAANPQPQDALATVFVQLQDVLQILSGVIGQGKFVGQEVVRSHDGGSSSDRGAATVARDGAPS